MTRHDQDRKTRILQAIAEGLRRNGTPPTVREIADLVGLAAPSAVHHHLEALEADRLIERESGLSRSIRITPSGRALLGLDDEVEVVRGRTPLAARELTVVGQIAAGGPIEAYEERSETLAVPEFMSTADSYLLKIRGDSMIDAQIADGDYVVIKPSQVAKNGDIVVAQVEENAVTLKRIYREGGRVRLQPANQAYPPMFYDEVRVQGVLVGVMRRVH
jgi:repressor LexA